MQGKLKFSWLMLFFGSLLILSHSWFLIIVGCFLFVVSFVMGAVISGSGKIMEGIFILILSVILPAILLIVKGLVGG